MFYEAARTPADELSGNFKLAAHLGKTQRGGKTLWGEVGVLREVLFTPVQPRSRIYLLMEHEGEEYIGALLFSDPAWVPQIRDLLKQHLGSRVACIGELEISQFD